VNYLRRKLKDPPPGSLIRTVRGHGYVVPNQAPPTLEIDVVLSPARGLQNEPLSILKFN
jgi:hypothetical protein